AEGETYGCTKIGVGTGHALSDRNYTVTPDFVAADLLAVATWLDENKEAATKKHQAAVVAGSR
ncbi:hypothetical protein IH781_03190, partial [Patescibacteria group bacterium]|nr:hypothetical protein [Patescibacteria group bacterium]